MVTGCLYSHIQDVSSNVSSMSGSDCRLDTSRLLRAMVEAMVMLEPRQQQRLVYHCLAQLLSFRMENIVLCAPTLQ